MVISLRLYPSAGLLFTSPTQVRVPEASISFFRSWTIGVWKWETRAYLALKTQRWPMSFENIGNQRSSTVTHIRSRYYLWFLSVHWQKRIHTAFLKRGRDKNGKRGVGVRKRTCCLIIQLEDRCIHREEKIKKRKKGSMTWKRDLL